MSEGKRVNIWTDSKYAFGVVHVHGALWKERGLLSSQGTHIKHQDAILQLIKAVQKPELVAIIHCKAHQSGSSKICEGNRKADWAARQVARKVQKVMALISTKLNISQFNLPPEPKYSAEDERLGCLLKARKNSEGWYVTTQGQIVVPPLIMREILQIKHNECHWGAEALVKLLRCNLISVWMLTMAKSVMSKCEICLKNNPVAR